MPVVPATRLQLSSTYRAGAQFPFGEVFEARILRRLNLGRLNALLEQTAEIITGVQALSHELHPPRLLHLGVVAAMQGFCGELSGQKNVEIDFQYENAPGSVPPDVSLCLFRVLQEALHNAVRHSRVRHFNVHLRGTGDAVHLTS
jgi:signal transduction histidine kinase